MMGRGSYNGGSTVFSPGSSFFSYTKAEPNHLEQSDYSHNIKTQTHKPKNKQNTKPKIQIIKIEPKCGREESFSLTVRELNKYTNRTKHISNSRMFEQVLKLNIKDCSQITLIDDSSHPNRSYTALVHDSIVRNIEVGDRVEAKMVGRGLGDYTAWVVICLSRQDHLQF